MRRWVLAAVASLATRMGLRGQRAQHSVRVASASLDVRRQAYSALAVCLAAASTRLRGTLLADGNC